MGRGEGRTSANDKNNSTRNGINPIESQVGMGSYSDVLGTDLRIMKTSEAKRKNTVRR